MKLFFTGFIIVLAGKISFSQPTIQWQKSLGGSSNEIAFYIHETSDSGFVITGVTDSQDGDVTGHHFLWDCWLVKLNSVGAIQWQKCLGGSGEDEAFCIRQTSDGGFIVAGLSESVDGDVTGNHGGWDYWIMKTDASGNLQWQKSLGGSMVDGTSFIEEMPGGGYIICGYSQSVDGDVTGNHGANDFWIVRIDSAGNLVWQKSLGGSVSDGATAIHRTSDGGMIISGSSSSNDGDVSGNHGNTDFWLVKTDSAATILWQKTFGGTMNDIANSMQITADGGFIIAGRTNSSDGDVNSNHGSDDFWLVKTDSAGNMQWQKSFGGSLFESGNSVAQTSDGGYIITGGTASTDGDVTGNHGSGDFLVIKTDSAGTIQWQKCLGGTLNDYAASVTETNDGGFAIAGTSYSDDGDVTGHHPPASASDFWVVKLAPYSSVEENIFSSGITVFPNPATTEIKVQSSKFKVQSVEVLDVVGMKHLTPNRSPSGEGSALINISGLNSGMYFLRIKTTEGFFLTAKFVKEN